MNEAVATKEKEKGFTQMNEYLILNGGNPFAKFAIDTKPRGDFFIPGDEGKEVALVLQGKGEFVSLVINEEDVDNVIAMLQKAKEILEDN